MTHLKGIELKENKLEESLKKAEEYVNKADKIANSDHGGDAIKYQQATYLAHRALYEQQKVIIKQNKDITKLLEQIEDYQ
ncbi:hypothetical protein CMI39_00555 [Candidatus Pacearchaeota archaeon]|jgi:hypothetical protein|nr:hypothetical protein [Candidatus Pacearchaeota archaeon]|tara:strand:- start:3853 stop:4092 length:240 start_codon:yes stop_codon:yes gene_type:complete